jgi:hypothetical protein
MSLLAVVAKAMAAEQVPIGSTFSPNSKKSRTMAALLFLVHPKRFELLAF